MRCARFIPILLAGAILLTAQNAATPTTFDVASVKLAGPQSRRNSSGGPGTPDPAHYRFHSASLSKT